MDFRGNRLRRWWREYQHRRNPDPATLAAARSANLILDPLIPPGQRAPSTRPIPDELEQMLQPISAKCEDAIALL
jgi:hypothetical protein